MYSVLFFALAKYPPPLPPPPPPGRFTWINDLNDGGKLLCLFGFSELRTANRYPGFRSWVVGLFVF